MKLRGQLAITAALSLALCLLNGGCLRKAAAGGVAPSDTGPVKSPVEPDMDANNFKVDHPERFPLTTAVEHIAAPELNVTGVVSPDVSRQVPVISLASGRISEIDARLGDEVAKGQLLFKVWSTDISSAFSDHRKAVTNEQLARTQLERAKTLYEHGAVPRSALETAQNAADTAKVDLDTSAEHLRVLGADPTQPTAIVEVHAPVSGVITDQQITNQSGVQALSAPNPMTISDMSHVWIICDVYENDMAQVHTGEFAEIHLAAYPSRILRGRISNILPVVDPTIRTAKVRLEVENPGLMRIGMFVTATFHGQTQERRAAVPATAILHLHDRDWVYTPAGNGRFRRVEVVGGSMLPDKMQEVLSGIRSGDQVIGNALVLQNTVEQ